MLSSIAGSASRDPDIIPLLFKGFYDSEKLGIIRLIPYLRANYFPILVGNRVLAVIIR